MSDPNAPPTTLGFSDALAMVEEEKTEIDKVIELMLDVKNIAHNTELNKNEIISFSTLGTIGEQHPELTALNAWLLRNLIYRVSKGRQGRKEIAKIVSRQLAMSDQAIENPAGYRKWFGSGAKKQ